MPNSTPSQTRTCTGKNARARGAVVSLPVLGASTPTGAGHERPPKIRRSRATRWRVGVLIGVHVVFVIHLTHWLINGRTISPVEPSEAMYTLEQGQLNAGFVFFIVALTGTLIFGRFFCGWACHIVALQDLCGWGMKKMGVRPKPFRSRLLVFAPLLLGLYMFVWPTFKRELLAPAIARWWPEGLALIGAAQRFPGFTDHFMKEDFWATFAAPLVAIPFLAVCGFATVYFLGAKGFCTYGCPYGGFFAPLQQVSPGRIMVDHDRCEGCGHCTAVCTSNVRVHEEIREYGGVVDPGCMKCLDCVSVCPNDALSFRFAAPPALKGKPKNAAPRRSFDMTWPEEIAVAGVFLLTFFGTRGVYGVVPMLFAVGLAGCAAFIFWKFWRLLREPNVRIIGAQLKRAGRFRPAGVVYAAAATLLGALLLHSFAVNSYRWRGDRADARVAVPPEIVFAGEFERIPPEMRADAALAIDHLTTASSFRAGGIGLAETPGVDLRLAWLHLVRGELTESERQLRRGLARQGHTDGLVADLARVIRLDRGAPAAIEHLEAALESHPDSPEARDLLVQLHVQASRPQRAVAVYMDAAERFPGDAAIHARLATLLSSLGQTDDARAAAERAVDTLKLRDATTRDAVCSVLLRLGQPERAVRIMEDAAADRPDDPQTRARLGLIYLETGRASDAARELARAAERRPRDVIIRNNLAVALFSTGAVADALAELKACAELAPSEAAGFYRMAGEMLMKAGRANEADLWLMRAELEERKAGPAPAPGPAPAQDTPAGP